MKRARYLVLRVLSVLAIGSTVQIAPAQSPAGLAIQILKSNEGENLTEKELPPVKVRVMDRTGRVIPGANVLFVAPEAGPTGVFLPNSSQIAVATDTQGIAIAPPFRTNSKVGEYEIQIVASYKDSVSKAAIPQTNLFQLKSSSSKKFIILSAVIGGAATAAFASRHGNSGPASAALGAITPTLTIGGSSGGLSLSTFAPAPTTSSTDTLSSATVSPVVTTSAAETSPSTTLTPVFTTSPTASTAPTTSGSTVTSSTSGTAQPTDVVQAPVQSPCPAMPLNSKKRSCR